MSTDRSPAPMSTWDRIPGWRLFEQIDTTRQSLGEALDAAGFAPIETPSRVVLPERGLALKAYGHAEHHGSSPVLLIVPAPIKPAYIWDLAPWASVVRHCMRDGMRVYLIDWARPGADEQGFGLAEYSDRFILECLDAIEAETGRSRVFLAGHSLGGTLAAIFSALHPERVQGMVLLGAPLQFGPAAGAFAPVVAAAPRVDHLTAAADTIPGSFLSLVSFAAAPDVFVWSRWVDWLCSLPDPAAVQTHLQVDRWMLDEMPLARQLFEEVVELLYRENRFMRGSIRVRGRRAAPELVEAPLLSVVDPRSRIVPPDSMLPFHRAVRSVDKRVLPYEGDVGVSLQHVGMLVGKTAHRHLWPEILRWMRTRGEAG